MAEPVTEILDWKHEYHAEAHALTGKIILPLKQDITPHALTVVPKSGGYRAQQAQQYRLETIISYGRAHTQVAGHEEIKEKGGYNTLATAVVEDVNIFNVVTADRVVAQIFTHHPKESYVPRISFLGTHFYNLRIAGRHVEPEMNLDIFGERPEDDRPYTRDSSFVSRVCDQHAGMRRHENVFEEIFDRYNRVPENFGVLDEKGQETVTCSLVNKVDNSPGKPCGHVITVRDFGKIYLAEVTLLHEDYNDKGIPEKTTVTLNMIRVVMGCAGNGNQDVACAKTNGKTIPPGGSTGGATGTSGK